MAINVAVEASDAAHPVGFLRLAVGGSIELLLRKLRYEQAQSVQLLWIKDAIEQVIEVVNGDELPL